MPAIFLGFQHKLVNFISPTDLVSITRCFIHAGASRSSISRLLRRAEVAKLADLQIKVENEEGPKKTFKDYVPGFVHIDIKYFPQMSCEDSRRYLFVSIDLAMR